MPCDRRLQTHSPLRKTGGIQPDPAGFFKTVFMMRKFIDYFSHNKYRLTMFFLLAGATVISVTTWRFRADYSWNSWDIITDPKGITHYTVQYTRDSSLQSIGFTGLIAIFFLYFM